MHIWSCKTTLKSEGGSHWVVPVAGARGEACCQGVRTNDASEPEQIILASYLKQELVVCLSLEVSFLIVIFKIASSSNRKLQVLTFCKKLDVLTKQIWF